MAKRNNLFFDSKMNEWMFDLMVKLPLIVKEKLNYVELKYVKNVSAIKRFVTNSSLERKLVFLTKAGIRWNIIFYQDSKVAAEQLYKTYRQYSMKGKTLENIEEMISHNTFVLGSQDVAISLGMMNNNVHSDNYVLNPAFLSFKKTMSVLKNANNSTKELNSLKNANIEHDNVTRETKSLSRMCIEVFRMVNFVESNYSLQMVDMHILWVLYQYPHSYINVEFIKRELSDIYKPQSVGNRCAYLFKEERMIDRRPSDEKSFSYIILQKGILTIGQINNYLVNKTYAP